MRYASALFTVPILLVIRSLGYWGLFRLWKLEVSYWTALLIAGAPLAMMVIPIPLPFVAVSVIGLAFAVYLSMRYGSVPFFPEALVVCLAVELGTWILGWLIFEKFTRT